MKYPIILSSMMICLAGCNENANSVAPFSDSVVWSNFMFTLKVANKSLLTNDTLEARVQAYNQATTQETLYVDTDWIRWWLNESSGTTVV